MFRGRRWFLPVLVLNVLMIGSVPTEGAHYVVDAIAGVIIALVARSLWRSGCWDDALHLPTLAGC